MLAQEIDGDRATVSVRVRNVSLPAVVADFLSLGNLLTFAFMGEGADEAIQAALIERIQRDDAPSRTIEADLSLKNVEGKWLMDIPSDFDRFPPPFWNAVLGYVADARW